MMKKLTIKQQRFIQEYLKCGNGTESAVKAGYSHHTAYSQANRLLNNVEIQKELEHWRSQIQQELREQFISDALTARKVLLQILNDPEASDKDKLTAARDLLDRAGFKPADRKELSGSPGAIEIKFVE